MNDKQLTGPVELTIHSTGLSNPFMQFTNASKNLFRIYSTQQIPDIRKVIFQKLHTIVIWEDGEKTVVKCSEEEFKTINRNDYIKYKKNRYDYEVLVEDKNEFKKKYNISIVDRPSLEDIMLIYIKGVK